MKILLVGNGGREHALAWKLLQSPGVEVVFCAPGNGGTQTLAGCENLAVAVEDIAGLVAAAQDRSVDLVVVGPEVPLALGLADVCRAQGIPVFGPGRQGAQVEASKAWAKALMMEAGVPTAQAQIFREPGPAEAFVRRQGAPVVIKADGLAAGKGVTVARTVEEALGAIRGAFGGLFGQAGETVLVEEYLEGEEISLLALTDGRTIQPLLAVQDHKRIGEGDTGANTGGMGTYCPLPQVDDRLRQKITTQVLEPTLRALQERGIDYRGVLYAGLMITPGGQIKVIEFNCRFGDPETQVLMPLLATPLADLLLACAEQRLDRQPPLAWHPGAAACVILAAAGYPGAYQRGGPITGLAAAAAAGALVFHSGTQVQAGNLVTDGGRVLGVTGQGPDLRAAFQSAYQAVDLVHFAGKYYRRDIGHRVLG